MRENKDQLGFVTAGARGFPVVLFKDAYEQECSIQCSSVIFDYPDSLEKPGTSAIWLGVNDAEPKVMASQAAAHGIETKETTGWVPFPISEDVSLSTRMHLNREQVAGLIVRLQEWLDNGAW